jgi:hypothetical protein
LADAAVTALVEKYLDGLKAATYVCNNCKVDGDNSEKRRKTGTL